MFCSKCGNELREGTKFCTKCGAPISASPADNMQKKRGRKRTTSIFVISGILLACIMCVVALGFLISVRGAGVNEGKVLLSNNNFKIQEVVVDKTTEVEKHESGVQSSVEKSEVAIKNDIKSEKRYFVDDAQVLAQDDAVTISEMLKDMSETHGRNFYVIFCENRDEIGEEYIINMYEQSGYGNLADEQAICLWIDRESAGTTVSSYGQEMYGFEQEIVNYINVTLNSLDNSEDKYMSSINKFIDLCREQLVASTYAESQIEFGVANSLPIAPTDRSTIALFLVNSITPAQLYKGAGTHGIILMSIPLSAEDTQPTRFAYIQRSTLLNIGDTYAKCPGAYSRGGAEQTLNMLNMNFDMAITDFVALGRGELASIVDYLGGMDLVIDVVDKHLIYGYEEGQNQLATGLQHLNGEEVSNYCFGAVSDYTDRSCENQVEVLNMIAQKIGEMNISEYEAAQEFIINEVYSSLLEDEVMMVLKQCVMDEVVQFPYSDMEIRVNMGALGSMRCSDDLIAGVKRLHYDLFGTVDYTPTSTVEEISEEIDMMIEQYLPKN